MEIKYTRDGKAVRLMKEVPGSGYIVHEVFVKENGNHYTGERALLVTELFDEPPVTPQEKRIQELKDSYAVRINRIEEGLKKNLREMRQKSEIMRDRVNQFEKLTRNFDHKALHTLFHFLKGEITHFYVKRYGQAKILTWEDKEINRFSHSGDPEGIKLLSLFGQTDGSLTWRINQYRDSSGDWTEIYPCCSYEEALAIAQEKVTIAAAQYLESGGNNNFNPNHWSEIDGLEIPPEAIRLFNKLSADSIQRQIKRHMEQILELEEKEKALSQEL